MNRPLGRSTGVRDPVVYALPVGELGDRLGMPVVRRDLARVFDHRRTVVARLPG